MPLNPQLAEVVASGLTVMVLIRKADFGISVTDYFYFMAQVRGMALEESLGAPALELYIEGRRHRPAVRNAARRARVFGPPLEAFREISRSGITNNVLAVPDGSTNVHEQGKTIDPVRLLREMTIRAAMTRSSASCSRSKPGATRRRVASGCQACIGKVLCLRDRGPRVFDGLSRGARKECWS